MKSFHKILFLFFVIQSGMWLMPEKSSAQVSVSFQIFYDDLSPYGSWIQNPEYGYVWIPNVDPGFTPYGSNGYWVYTDFGWTWVSNYPWGWAPFHYGRWYSDPVYGPIWVPGNEWGPGWVTWRRSEGYYGWAPIGPGISINIAYSNSYNVPRDQWRFVRDRDFGRRDIHNYYVNSSNTTTIINNSTVINNTYIDNSNHVTYNTGPERAEVQKRTGSKINAVPLKEYNKPGQQMSKGELQMYRPRIENNNAAGNRPAPSKVSDLKEVKPVKERHSDVQSPNQSKPGKAQPAQQPRRDQPVKKVQPGIQPKQNQPKQNQPKRDQPAIHQPQQPKNQQKDNQPAQQQKRVQPQQPQNKPDLNQPAEQPRRDQQKQQQAKPQQNQSPRQPSTQPKQEQRAVPHPQNRPPVRQKPAQQKQQNVNPEKDRPSQNEDAKHPK
ncbi:MAG: hypothetical protein IPJ66_14525 [Bacteroidetes bacterium]|nr:hypothetical protein [Bacteroidota bacterium]MBL0137783.1 hypothetical protein [Bacteroidota bacterium]